MSERDERVWFTTHGGKSIRCYEDVCWLVGAVVLLPITVFVELRDYWRARR